MGREIERKFLVQGDGWREGAQGVLMRQGYLSRERERTVRVRLAGGRGYLTVKGINEGISRLEYEYEIPAADAAEMLDTLALRPLVEKIRYRVPFGGRTWEVDEFLGDNAGLIVAEIELEAVDSPLEKPAWAGAEVSADPRYFNSSLSRRPYRLWAQDVA